MPRASRQFVFVGIVGIAAAGETLVLFAAVMGSIESRKQEAGLLRALGSSRRLMLGSVLVEFAILGFLSGLIAIVGAESFLFALQHLVFKNEMQPHYAYWFVSPLIGMGFIATLGVVCCRSVVVTPPAVVLRNGAFLIVKCFD